MSTSSEALGGMSGVMDVESVAADVASVEPGAIVLDPTPNDRAFEYYSPLKKVKEYVEHNYPEKITLAKVARVAGLERKYLSAYFHRKVGTTFTRWVTWVRVREALRRMASEDVSITNIANDVGLDVRSFERSVKRLTGRTPRELKRRFMP
jgi:AraC-like DNA-binding protein